MLPPGIAAGQSAGTATASLVHFPYGLAPEQMLRGAGAWTTDRARRNMTRRELGLQPAESDLAAWESAELLPVTVPRWFDLAGDFPANVVHAGPLGVTRPTDMPDMPRRRPPLVLVSFSTTVMQGQNGPRPARLRSDRRRESGCDPHVGTGGARRSDPRPGQRRGRSVRRPRSAAASVCGSRHAWWARHDAARSRPRQAASALAARTRPGVQREARRRARCRHPPGR
jgi:hypothetical protein